MSQQTYDKDESPKHDRDERVSSLFMKGTCSICKKSWVDGEIVFSLQLIVTVTGRLTPQGDSDGESRRSLAPCRSVSPKVFQFGEVNLSGTTERCRRSQLEQPSLGQIHSWKLIASSATNIYQVKMAMFPLLTPC